MLNVDRVRVMTYTSTRTYMDMERVLNELVKSKPSANGLAIIIGNETSCKPEHVPLSGTIKDLEDARDAFESLKFTTLPIRNASAQEIIDIVQAASCYKYPSCYKRLAFVFSGHGDANYIYAHDSAVHLQTSIFDPWMPRKSPDLAHIPKLFFLDACRGDAVDQGIFKPLPDGPVPKGAGRAPSVGNYLLANSTLPTMKAFEKPYAGGGYWMQHLARELRLDRNIDQSLTDILVRVNGLVIAEMQGPHYENIQQPVFETTLLELIYPIKEARYAGFEVLQNFPPYVLPQKVLQGREFLVEGHQGTPLNPTIVNSQQQHPIWIVAHGNNQSPIQAIGATSQPQPFQPQLFQSPSGGAQNTELFVNVPPFLDGSSVPSQMQDYYQKELDCLAQNRKIERLNYFDEPRRYDDTLCTVLYRSHVSFRHVQTGREIVGSSMDVEYQSKAREQAAEHAWSQVESMKQGMVARPLQFQEGRGSSKSSATTTCTPASKPPKPTSKVWKSKLEQHYDKKPAIKYVSKESPKGGFESRVFCPDIGYAEGEGATKAAAENNAAYNAVKKLEMSGKQSDPSS